MNKNSKKNTIIGIIVITLLVIVLGIVFFGGDGSSSSYQLHNKDGSINWNYYSDMQDYFARNPDKLP